MLGRVVLVVALFGLLAVAPSADAYIYWTSLDGGNSRLGRADLDGTDVDPTLVGGIPLITAVASDGTYVYWTQSGGPSAIGRATVAGGSVSSPFQNTGNPAFDVAVDGANLHWMYNTGGVPDRAVNRAPKTGGQSPTQSVAANGICGIATDDSYLYWSAGQYVGRSLLNGGSPNPTWLFVGSPDESIEPCGVAVNASHVFWTVHEINNIPGTSIGRATIDGAEASVNNDLITGLELNSTLGFPSRLAVDGGSIYWTDRPGVTGSIGRANLDGTGVDRSFIPNIFQVSGVAVDSAGPGGGGGPGGEGAPIQGEQVNVRPLSGTVRIKRPGESSFTELTAGATIPVGSLVDTREGTVELTVASKGDGKLQTAKFKYGLFKITQSTSKGAFAELKLKGELERCGNRKAASPRRGKGGRRLWGNGTGRFTSRGHRGSGSARGTIWQVSDRCDDTTLIESIKGKVWARDFAKGKRVVLKSGEQYVAGAKKRK